MRLLLNREHWSGPVGMARILGMVCAAWTIAAALVGATGARLMVPMFFAVIGVAFVAGYELGRKQP
jgi:hypothetical protein